MANIIHSEKGNGFHNFFQEQCDKVARTHNRCNIESHKAKYSKAFVDGYDNIKWEQSKETNLVKHL